MSHPKKPKKKPTGDYAVGFCKPPESAKWQPGKSANPSGRPPKIPAWEELVVAELFKPVKAIVGGKEIEATKLEFLLQRGLQKAMEGNTPLFKLMMSHAQAAIEKMQKKAEQDEEKAKVMAEIIWTEEHEKLLQEIDADIGKGGGDKPPDNDESK